MTWTRVARVHYFAVVSTIFSQVICDPGTITKTSILFLCTDSVILTRGPGAIVTLRAIPLALSSRKAIVTSARIVPIVARPQTNNIAFTVLTGIWRTVISNSVEKSTY